MKKINYELVYSINDYLINPTWIFPFSILLILIFSFFFKKRIKLNNYHILITFPLILLFYYSIYSSITYNIRINNIIKNKNYKLIEGEINDFIPMKYGGHGLESFRVKGILFQYSENSITGCFNDTKNTNGPITDNRQKVKIAYNGNCILQLWIK